MSTRELIDAALAAMDVDAQAAANLAAAAQARQQAKANLTAANQALHDDLAQNGPAVTVDDSTDPPTVILYQAVDPGSWSAQEIRAA